MRKVRYKGEDVTLGRFGQVKNKDILMLREAEWEAVENDPRFSLVGKVTEEVDDRVKPSKTPVFDLRAVKWNSGRLERVLGRYTKNKLLRIAEGMSMAGAPIVRPESKDISREDLIDLIHFTANKCGWTSLSREKILTAGTLSRRRRVKKS